MFLNSLSIRLVCLIFFFFVFIKLSHRANQFFDNHFYSSNRIIITVAPSIILFTLTRLLHADGTEKMCSHSELRGVHKGGVQNQQNSLGGTGECSV